MDKNSLIKEFLFEVKKNKKYSAISDDIVFNEIDRYIKSNPKIINVSKQPVKEIRSGLHRIYASYQIGKSSKREKFLEELKKDPRNIEIINEILLTAVSTKERLKDYPELYKNIFSITGKPETIIDLGAGINPVSYSYMNLEKLNYHSYDINEKDISFLNDFFKIMNKSGLDGKAEILDVSNLEKIKELPNADIIFMLKLLDLINMKNKKPGEDIIKSLINKTKFIIASFSTKTISGKPMNLPRRTGFEIMLKRNNLKFQTIKISNEIFYVISNS